MKEIRLTITFFLLMIIGSSCSVIKARKLEKRIAKSELRKRNKLEKIREISRQYLETQISNVEIFDQIKFDTIFTHTGHFALYNVGDESYRENMLIVFVNHELAVDTINSVVNSRMVSSFLENPTADKLTINRKDAFNIAKRENFENGIKPWEIQMVAYGGDLKDLRWNITNTISRRRGKTLSINVFSMKINYTSWQSSS